MAGEATASPTNTVTATTSPPSPTASTTPSPTLTPTPTHTPSPTPTPTPTALPAGVSGDPRAASYHPPAPSGNAPCGVVDTLDYPLQPPDAVGARGGTDFGLYRNRYEKIHAGEDWGITRGEGNFGQPVYSIGHGLITYAEPEGWGRDQGVVIVRHTFADGRTFLSFYGHLDPPSVERAAGTCVVRGDLLGAIGRPRSSPHLHFEIRTHMPYQPGPGYWETDPTTAGWLPPSLTVWQERVTASAGVLWRDTLADSASRPVGSLENGDYLLLAGAELQRLQLADGNQTPLTGIMENIGDAVVDVSGRFVYTADRLGRVAAYRPAGSSAADPLEEQWAVDFDLIGTPTLMPLPGGGVVFFARNELLTLSPAGDVLARQSTSGRVFSWAVSENRLLISFSGSAGQLWLVGEEGQIQAGAEIEGLVSLVGGQIWVYAADGLYRLDEAAGMPTLMFRLPTAFLEYSDILVLSDGSVLLAHRDIYDRRLIHLAADGRLLWERSLSAIDAGEMRLVELQGQVYLVNGLSGAANRTLAVYALDNDRPDLVKVLDLPIRAPVGLSGWAWPQPAQALLLGLDETLFLFDPQEVLNSGQTTE